MGTKRRRRHILLPTTGALSWVIKEHDDFDVLRIALMFSASPSAIENINIWHRSELGPDFDCIIRTHDPNGMSNLAFECINGMEDGDWLEVVYANSESLTIRGTATVEI